MVSMILVLLGDGATGDGTDMVVITDTAGVTIMYLRIELGGVVIAAHGVMVAMAMDGTIGLGEDTMATDMGDPIITTITGTIIITIDVEPMPTTTVEEDIIIEVLLPVIL